MQVSLLNATVVLYLRTILLMTIILIRMHYFLYPPINLNATQRVLFHQNWITYRIILTNILESWIACSNAHYLYLLFLNYYNSFVLINATQFIQFLRVLLSTCYAHFTLKYSTSLMCIVRLFILATFIKSVYLIHLLWDHP